MNRDNEAFAAECEQSSAKMKFGNPPEKVQEGDTKQPAFEQGLMNVPEHECSGSNENNGGQEMQERPGSNLLSARAGDVMKNAAVSRALDDDDEWKSDEEMDHVENTKPS